MRSMGEDILLSRRVDGALLVALPSRRVARARRRRMRVAAVAWLCGAQPLLRPQVLPYG